jgi:hypothetical protein
MWESNTGLGSPDKESYIHVEDLIVDVVITKTAGDEEAESMHLVCRKTDRSFHVG